MPDFSAVPAPLTYAVFDTACGSLNSGDHIIMRAVQRELTELFPHDHRLLVPTHLAASNGTLRRVAETPFCFVGGTNLLSPRVRWSAGRNQWAVGALQARLLQQRCVLLGCGARREGARAGLTARGFYRQALSPTLLHSVRDASGAAFLRGAGIQNLLVTGCPTLWRLPQEAEAIPAAPAPAAVFTLTDYAQDPEADRRLVETVLAQYSEVHFWLQGHRDHDYLSALLTPAQRARIRFVGPALEQYQALLQREAPLDYVGTRLHAGIFALEHRRRSVIVAVDHRAREVAAEAGIPVIERTALAGLPDLLGNPIHTRIRLDHAAIRQWKQQFQRPAAPAP